MAIQTEQPTQIAKEQFLQTALINRFLTPDQVDIVWDFHSIEGRKRHPAEVCASLGLLDEQQARALKHAMDGRGKTPASKAPNPLDALIPPTPAKKSQTAPPTAFKPPAAAEARRSATLPQQKPRKLATEASHHALVKQKKQKKTQKKARAPERSSHTPPAPNEVAKGSSHQLLVGPPQRHNTPAVPPPIRSSHMLPVAPQTRNVVPSAPAAVSVLDAQDGSLKIGPGLLGLLLKQAIERGASDLHVYSNMSPFVRIAGTINELPGAAPVDEAKLLQELKPVLQPAHWAQLKEQGDVDVCPTFNGGYRLRTNIHRARNGLCVTMRIVPPKVLSMHELGLPSAVGGLTAFKQGLVLIAGPAGSGKTSTMASLLLRMNTLHNFHIVTIEDPIEFVHVSRKSSITQRCVGLHTKSYATALRAALREDPDVIVIGELRDPDTIRIAMEAAETGHLVLGTLHTWDVESTLARILDAFEGEEEQARGMLADTLRGVLTQQLIRAPTGRRYPIVELMYNNSAIANCIRKRKLHQLQSLIHAGRQQQNMMTWEDSVQELQRKNAIHAQHATQILNSVLRSSALGG